jgi:hypothetical protein
VGYERSETLPIEIRYGILKFSELVGQGLREDSPPTYAGGSGAKWRRITVRHRTLCISKSSLRHEAKFLTWKDECTICGKSLPAEGANSAPAEKPIHNEFAAMKLERLSRTMATRYQERWLENRTSGCLVGPLGFEPRTNRL